MLLDIEDTISPTFYNFLPFDNIDSPILNKSLAADMKR